MAYAKANDFPVIENRADLAGDAETAAIAFARRMRAGPPGLYLAGGETAVELPENPGRGGRNQAFALAAALELAGAENIWLLAAGSDGDDGNNRAAGGLVNGQTALAAEPARQALAAADAGSYLAAHGALFCCAPTETNVMDLVVGWKGA